MGKTAMEMQVEATRTGLTEMQMAWQHKGGPKREKAVGGRSSRQNALERKKKGKGAAYVRKRVAAVPVSAFLANRLEAVGIHAYTHVPRLGNISPERYSKRPPFP